MQTIAIDFGEKRVGIALAEGTSGVAVPLKTIQRTSDHQLIDRLRDEISEYDVERLVVGLPLGQDGREREFAKRVRSFATKLREALGLEVALVPETLTTREARRILAERGVDLRRHPERIDQVAAQLILQDLLDQERREAEHGGSE